MTKKKSNQKRFAPKIHIKKGDQVLVISGASKSNEAREVLEVFPSKYRAIVDGANIAKKHVKPTQDDQGGIREIPMPIHISNLMLVDPKTGGGTRIGRKVVDGKLVRYSKKSDEIIK